MPTGVTTTFLVVATLILLTGTTVYTDFVGAFFMSLALINEIGVSVFGGRER